MQATIFFASRTCILHLRRSTLHVGRGGTGGAGLREATGLGQHGAASLKPCRLLPRSPTSRIYRLTGQLYTTNLGVQPKQTAPATFRDLSTGKVKHPCTRSQIRSEHARVARYFVFEPRLSGSSEVFSSPRRRAEEYLAGPSASQSTWRSGSEDGRHRWKTSSSNLVSCSSSLQSLPSVSRAGPGPAGASRAWHQGLSRRLAEVQTAVHDYRHRLLKSLGALSDAAWFTCLLFVPYFASTAACRGFSGGRVRFDWFRVQR